MSTTTILNKNAVMFVSKQLFILISGKAGVGKTFYASKICDKLKESGLITEIFSFAQGVKDDARKYHGWNGIKDNDGRKLLQQIGNSKREEDPDFWVKALIDRIQEYESTLDAMLGLDVIIIDDWRYPNECEYIKNNSIANVFTLRIEGDTSLKDELGDDISETSLDKYSFDFLLNNSDVCYNNSEVCTAILVDYILHKKDLFF